MAVNDIFQNISSWKKHQVRKTALVSEYSELEAEALLRSIKAELQNAIVQIQNPQQNFALYEKIIRMSVIVKDELHTQIRGNGNGENKNDSIGISRVFVRGSTSKKEIVLECLLSDQFQFRKLPDSAEGFNVFIIPERGLSVLNSDTPRTLEKQLQDLKVFQLTNETNHLEIRRRGNEFHISFDGFDRIPCFTGRNTRFKGKCYMVFKTFVGRIEITIKSAPFMLGSNPSQSLDHWMEILWDSAFCPEYGQVPPQSIEPLRIVELLSRQFAHYTARPNSNLQGRGFTHHEIASIIPKIESLGLENLTGVPGGGIALSKLVAAAFRSDVFKEEKVKKSFSDWIFKILKLCSAPSTLNKCWLQGWVQLISHEVAASILEGKDDGTFTMRFSDHNFSSITSVYRTSQRHTLSTRKYEPHLYKSDAKFVKFLEERRRFTVLHTGVPKNYILSELPVIRDPANKGKLGEYEYENSDDDEIDENIDLPDMDWDPNDFSWLDNI